LSDKNKPKDRRELAPFNEITLLELVYGVDLRIFQRKVDCLEGEIIVVSHAFNARDIFHHETIKE